jgi:hypothetical protein
VLSFSRILGSHRLRHLSALLLLCASLAAVQVVDAQRQLPQESKYAKGAKLNYPFVKVGKEVLRLSPGSKIYNDQNLIIMPATAPASADVLYRVDINGEISQIWLLTPEESKAAAAKK